MGLSRSSKSDKEGQSDWKKDARDWFYDKLGGTGQRGKQIERQLKCAETGNCKKKK